MDATSYRAWAGRRLHGVIGRVQRVDFCRQGATGSWARPWPTGRASRRSDGERVPVRAGSGAACHRHAWDLLFGNRRRRAAVHGAASESCQMASGGDDTGAAAAVDGRDDRRLMAVLSRS